MRCRNILFVGNSAEYFLSHRLELAKALLQLGHKVTAILPGPVNPAVQQAITGVGLAVEEMPYHPAGMNPFRDGRTLWSLWRHFRRQRPDVVHLLTIKPILLGGIAARLAGVSARIHSVLGLGHLFYAQSWRVRLVRWLLRPCFRFAFGGEDGRIIVQNAEDGHTLVREGYIGGSDTGRLHLVRGSGVDLADYQPEAKPEDPPIVLFAGRLTRAKGLPEFVAAARALRGKYPQVRFVVCGGVFQGNPGALDEAQMKNWEREGVIEWWGRRDDLPAVLARCCLLVQPSWYGEGVPRILIEAAAAGRAAITTDIPGCRDIVQDGGNGLLVPPRDAVALAAAIGRLLDDAELRRTMGAAGRVLAAEFALDKVIAQTMRVYDELPGQDHTSGLESNHPLGGHHRNHP